MNISLTGLAAPSFKGGCTAASQAGPSIQPVSWPQPSSSPNLCHCSSLWKPNLLETEQKGRKLAANLHPTGSLFSSLSDLVLQTFIFFLISFIHWLYLCSLLKCSLFLRVQSLYSLRIKIQLLTTAHHDYPSPYHLAHTLFSPPVILGDLNSLNLPAPSYLWNFHLLFPMPQTPWSIQVGHFL